MALSANAKTAYYSRLLEMAEEKHDLEIRLLNAQIRKVEED